MFIEDDYSSTDEVLSLLRQIADKLDRNNDIMLRVFEEMQKLNLSRDKTRIERKKRIISNLSDVEIDSLVNTHCLFMGFEKDKLVSFFGDNASTLKITFQPPKKFISLMELLIACTGFQENDMLLFDLDSLITLFDKKQSGIDVIIEMIKDKIVTVVIGKGESARAVKFDIPALQIHFFTETDYVLPKDLEPYLNCIYQKQ